MRRFPQGAEAGFTLLEIVCVMAIVSMLAMLILPAIPRGTSRTRLQAFALQTASLLKTDRLAAMHRLLKARGFYDGHDCVRQGYVDVLRRAVRA